MKEKIFKLFSNNDGKLNTKHTKSDIPEVSLIKGNEFLEKYNDGYFLMPSFAISDDEPRLRTIFHQSEDKCAKLENGDMKAILKNTFYVSKNMKKLVNL